MAFNKNKNKLDKFLLTDKSSFRSREEYKVLRTNVILSFTEPGAKVIAVTSSARSEGKSTNAINLATSFAELDKKVLIIDCDLRLPTVASKLQLKYPTERKGLTDMLVENINVREVICTDEERDICILPAGTLPPDPTILLQSERMRALMNVFRKTFDYIILDCPPITEVIDAVLLSPLVDGYILIVKHSASEHRNIGYMLEQLQRSNARILGFVYVNAPVESRIGHKRYDDSYYKKGK